MTNPSKPAKLHLRTGDSVVVLSGANRGKTGTIVRVFRQTGRVLVDGEAAVHHTRHVKPDPQKQIEGGRVQRLRPIHISNIALLDPVATQKADGKPTACRVKIELDDGGKPVRDTDGKPIRVSKKSGHRFVKEA